MAWRQVGSTVVVVAQHFNPSVVSQLWLVRHGLLGEDELLPGHLFGDMIAQVRTEQFNLLVIPDQLQFAPKVSDEDQQNLVSHTVGTIVRTLPHTPFRAMGLNFNWHLTPNKGNIAELTRELFYNQNRPLYEHFDEEDAHFGAYLSKNSLGFRLKLDAKPILVEEEEESENRIQFLFNFHADLTVEDPVQQIEELLGRWDQAKREAETIIEAIEP